MNLHKRWHVQIHLHTRTTNTIRDFIKRIFCINRLFIYCKWFLMLLDNQTKVTPHVLRQLIPNSRQYYQKIQANVQNAHNTNTRQLNPIASWIIVSEHFFSFQTMHAIRKFIQHNINVIKLFTKTMLNAIRYSILYKKLLTLSEKQKSHAIKLAIPSDKTFNSFSGILYKCQP